MYSPALKGLFNFLCVRPLTSDCNYVRQRSIGGSYAVTGLNLALYRSIHFHPKGERGVEKMKWRNQLVLGKESSALIKNKEIKQQRTVTEKRRR